MRLSGWGRHPWADGALLAVRTGGDVTRRLRPAASLIARGNGRAYGDAALNPQGMLSMLPMDRLLAFDPATGLLTCEAGVTLADILAVFGPRGWFPVVTPGTKFVTIGGAIAADVHGKNHHRDGGFGAHVRSLDLALADGRVVTCGPGREPELFAATLGGMGLTGVILRASFRLRPIETAWIRQETRRAATLDDALALFEQSGDRSYSVAWIDALAGGASLGRSVLMLGEHAVASDLPAGLRAAPLVSGRRGTLRVPCDFPGCALNRHSVAAFNEAYYRLAVPGTRLVDLERFFYPLDALLDWNRLYGRRGFVQYQCVVPRAAAAGGLRRLLTATAASGLASFLAVLKLLGPQGAGLLSFPLDGYTLALDFPATAPVFALFRELDAIVADHGGRLYLAKDARMDAEALRRGYPELDRFLAARQAWGARSIFHSLQSRRLGI